MHVSLVSYLQTTSNIFFIYNFPTSLYHFLQVSSSSKKDLSESSIQKSVYLGLSQVVSAETPITLPNNANTLSMERLEFPIPHTFDMSTVQSEITLTNQCSSPQEKEDKLLFPKHSEDPGLANPSSMTQDSVYQTAQDRVDDQIAVSSESSLTPQGSGSPQLDQLLSDLEEIKLKFKPEKLDLPLSESTEGSPEVDQMYKFEDLSPEDQCPSEHGSTIIVSVSSVIQLAGDNNCTNVAVTDPELVVVTPDISETSETSEPSTQGKDSLIVPTESFLIPESAQGFDKMMEPSLSASFPLDISQSNKCDEMFFPKVIAKSQSDIPEKHLCEEDLTTDIPQNQEVHEILKSASDSKSVAEEILTQSSVEPEDSSSLCPDLTSKTVIAARHFSFEQQMLFPFSGNPETFLDEDKPGISGHNSQESLTSLDYEHFASECTSVDHKAEISSSASDEEYSIPPGYAECVSTTNTYTRVPTGFAEVLHSGADSPTFEYSDPESYFDCRQAASDFSEAEPDEPETRTRSARDHLQDHPSHDRVLEQMNQRELLSSGSEDYEDTAVYEPLHNVHGETEELQHYSETSDEEEFSFCEASQPPPVSKVQAYDDTDKSLTRVRWGLINYPNLPAFPRPELNQILYLLQSGMTANPRGNLDGI